jgi:hypothetical protein
MQKLNRLAASRFAARITRCAARAAHHVPHALASN